MNEYIEAAYLPHRIWIDRTGRVISFHEVEDGAYEALEFPDGETVMEFVLLQCSGGFQIQ